MSRQYEIGQGAVVNTEELGIIVLDILLGAGCVFVAASARLQQ